MFHGTRSSGRLAAFSRGHRRSDLLLGEACEDPEQHAGLAGHLGQVEPDRPTEEGDDRGATVRNRPATTSCCW